MRLTRYALMHSDGVSVSCNSGIALDLITPNVPRSDSPFARAHPTQVDRTILAAARTLIASRVCSLFSTSHCRSVGSIGLYLGDIFGRCLSLLTSRLNLVSASLQQVLNDIILVGTFRLEHG